MRKIDQPLGAADESREVADVEAAGVEAVTGKKNAGLAIVESEAEDVVSGDREDVKDAAAQVDGACGFGPSFDLEELGRAFHFERDDCGVRKILELRVARNVIAVGVGVRDDERDRGAVIALAPVVQDGGDGARGLGLAGTGIFKQSAVAAEDQIEKRLFVIRAAGFAEDVEVFVVLMNLPIGDLDAIGAAGDPVIRQGARAHARSIGLRSLGERNRGEKKTTQKPHKS